MIDYPTFDKIAFEIGPFACLRPVGRSKVHWYGIMYLVGFAAGWWLARRRARKPGLDLEARSTSTTSCSSACSA